MPGAQSDTDFGVIAEVVHKNRNEAFDEVGHATVDEHPGNAILTGLDGLSSSREQQYRKEIGFKPYTPRAKAYADFVDDAVPVHAVDYPAPPTCSMPKYHVEYTRQFGSDSVSVTFISETVDQLAATVKELQEALSTPR